jgi:hypothetical protein
VPLIEKNARTIERCPVGRSRSVECKPEYRHSDLMGTRSFWCLEHDQWITVYPESVTLTYNYGPDGLGATHAAIRASFVPMEGYVL